MQSLSKKIRNHCKYDSVELSIRARGSVRRYVT